MEKRIRKKIELLAPAGSIESVKKAIEANCDSLYMGGKKFGARAFAKSVEEDSIIEAIEYSHKYNKKIYLTINTLFKDNEICEIEDYTKNIVEAKVDGFIVADFGAAKILKYLYPHIPLIASTQMTVASSKSINLLEKMGFSEVVLSRELSISEIKKIKKELKNDIKLECFIHGSMCYCFSGACLYSSFIGGESGNRGRCKGPCRLPYSKNNGKVKNNEKYLLSMKDMCALSSLYDLIKIGIDTLKIEGRMRSEKYVYEVVKVYRKYIDSIYEYIEKNDEKDENTEKNIYKNYNLNIINDEKYLLNVYNKGGFTNYYDKHNDIDMIQRYERK